MHRQPRCPENHNNLDRTEGPGDRAATYGTHCKRCSALDPKDYIQCHHCGRYVCGDCQTEAEDETNSCTECFDKEVIRLSGQNRRLHRHTEDWRNKYLALKTTVEPKRDPSDLESLITARRARIVGEARR